MEGRLKKYSVQHPLLQRYIKFFWEIRSDFIELNHKIIPVRNIDLKFNLSETDHYYTVKNKTHRLDRVYFSGMQDHFRNASIIIKGKVHVIGVCFYPDGFYPFIKVPLSAFKNHLNGAAEVGFKQVQPICEQLKEASDIAARLRILEKELLAMLNNRIVTPDNFQQLFTTLIQKDSTLPVSDFCEQHHIGARTLERLFSKYIGISASTYRTLNRFQNSVNQLFSNDFEKLSDIAYGNDYYDQMHFIRDFKRFAGNTPQRFAHQNNSMIHIGKQV